MTPDAAEPCWPDRAEAGTAILAAEPMEVPATAEELKAELDALHNRGL